MIMIERRALKEDIYICCVCILKVAEINFTLNAKQMQNK